MKSKDIIILAGIQHVGKTTLGRLLSKKLDCRFVDTDLETERLTGSHPRKITADGGQKAYNAAETKTIMHILSEFKKSSAKRIVISTGGGFCDNPKGICELNKVGIIVCLDADLETGFSRILAETKKDDAGNLFGYPIYPGYEHVIPKDFDEVRKIYYAFQSVRIARYKELSDVIVKVNSESPEKNLAKIENTLIAAYSSDL